MCALLGVDAFQAHRGDQGVGCVAVVVVAAVAAAGAGCPGAGVATSWKLKKFGRENYNNQ